MKKYLFVGLLACLTAIVTTPAQAGNWVVSSVIEVESQHICYSGEPVGNASTDQITIDWGVYGSSDTEEVATPFTRLAEDPSTADYWQNGTAIKTHGSLANGQPAGISMIARARGHAEFEWDPNATQHGTIPGNTGAFQVNWTKHWSSSSSGYAGAGVLFDGASPGDDHYSHTNVFETEENSGIAVFEWETQASGGGFTPYPYDAYSAAAYATWKVEFDTLASV